MIKSLKNFSVFCAIVLPVAATPAHAAMTIDSSAYALSASLSAANTVLVNLGPLAASDGSAPGAYSDSASLATVHQNLQFAGLLGVSVNQRIDAGIVQSSAASPFPVTPTGTASASIANADLGLTTQALFLPAVTVLGINADAIQSTTTVSAVNGLSAAGSSTLAGLDLDLAGLGLGNILIDTSLYINPDPNTVLLNLLGLKIVLNEQIWSGNGTTDLGLSTNALRLSFNDFLLGGRLVTGDVILGHSQASISGYQAVPPTSPVPEPASWALMITGFGLIGAATRTRWTRAALA